ncbi:hypothetical protein ACF073_23900 [Streptomyces sp. NPDC015171]|uniref:hypothetical protein n=1 Tax=Streptomyces sp. NPDC015171 TaxID=3364945 RepID=UPI0036FB5F9C
MLIEGYDFGPLVEGERLLERAGFWSNHLLAMCRFVSGEARPAPEWFGDDGADTDALAEVLLDDQAWPTFRIPFEGGHSAVVVYRNLVGDFGVDYLLTGAGWLRAEELASLDSDWYGPGLSWRDIMHIAETPDLAAVGVHDTAGPTPAPVAVARRRRVAAGGASTRERRAHGDRSTRRQCPGHG